MLHIIIVILLLINIFALASIEIMAMNWIYGTGNIARYLHCNTSTKHLAGQSSPIGLVDHPNLCSIAPAMSKYKFKSHMQGNLHMLLQTMQIETFIAYLSL